MADNSAALVSCRVASAILRYAAANDLDPDALCEGLNYSRARLEDNRAWVDPATILELWQRLEQATHNPDIGLEVGLFAIRKNTLGPLTTIFRLTGSPAGFLQKADRYISYFDKFHQLQPLHIGDLSALVEMKSRDGLAQTHYDCAFTRGVLAGMPTLWKLPEAKVEEIRCAVPPDKASPIQGRMYRVDAESNVSSCDPQDPENWRPEGALGSDGAFPVGETVYGAGSCLYHLTWSKFTTSRWWQRIFPDRASLAETAGSLEKDLRDIETMYEELSRVSSELELKVAERTESLEQANRELAELAEKLKVQSRLKSQFIADLSHELRTLITAIVGFAELLTSGIYGPLNAKQNTACERIVLNTRTLLHMINDLLDLSRLQAGRMEVMFGPVHVRQLVEEAMDTVSGLTEQKDLLIGVRIDPAAPLLIVSDKTKLKQMLLNLLSNAIKFTDRGHVTLRVNLRETGYIAFTVEDTGRGIEQKDLPLLFDEYSRVGDRSKDENVGSGLGLYITKKMMELLGGRIEVASQVGAGSSFSLILPLQPPKEQERSEPLPLTSLDPIRSQLVVMIADSDPEAIQFLGLSLEAEGLKVEGCTDGRLLLEELKRSKADLLVMDPLLNYQDGWGILQQLYAQPDSARLPVIVVSEAAESELCRSLGVTASFTKPYDRQAVVSEVLRALGLKEGGS